MISLKLCTLSSGFGNLDRQKGETESCCLLRNSDPIEVKLCMLLYSYRHDPEDKAFNGFSVCLGHIIDGFLSSARR